MYETDFHRWTQDTAALLRRGEFSALDIAALTEEIEQLGRAQELEIMVRVKNLIFHLLKWDEEHKRSYAASIKLQRTRIERLLKESPSLVVFLSETLAESYLSGVRLAVKSSGGRNKRSYPIACPYSVEEILRAKKI